MISLLLKGVLVAWYSGTGGDMWRDVLWLFGGYMHVQH
jgi:hypothetical protein